MGKKCWLPEKHYFLGTNCLGRADCLRTNCFGGRGAGCLGSTVFLGINWLDDRGTDHLRISALCLGRVGANCLSIICLGGRGTSCLRSTVFSGTACLGRADYLRADCLKTNCLGGRSASCLRSTVFPGTTCLGDRGTSCLGAGTPCPGID